MTIKQYQKTAATIAKKINDLGGDVNKVRHLKLSYVTEIGVRDPKKYKDYEATFTSGEDNTTLEFDTISNPNNPNAAFRTLKPGSISLFNSETKTNVDGSDFNYDSTQFADLIDAISSNDWKIA